MSLSKPVFSDLFTLSGRRNRSSYVLVQLATFIGVFVGVFVMFVGLAAIDKDTGTGLAAIIGGVTSLAGLVLIAGSLLSSWITAAQRVRDIGHAGPWCLLILVPYIGFVAALFILFAAGDTLVANRYGPSCITPTDVTGDNVHV
jgi:uncharacterized membrane protein YhaH (DUF805 family)